VKEVKPKATYHIIALDQMSIDNPSSVKELINEVVADFNTGNLEPIPVTIYPIHEVKQAFRLMAQGKHTGKLVLSWDPKNEPKLANQSIAIYKEGNYLITGGLGGL